MGKTSRLPVPTLAQQREIISIPNNARFNVQSIYACVYTSHYIYISNKSCTQGPQPIDRSINRCGWESHRAGLPVAPARWRAVRRTTETVQQRSFEFFESLDPGRAFRWTRRRHALARPLCRLRSPRVPVPTWRCVLTVDNYHFLTVNIAWKRTKQ
jgi:hypothetical protein